MPSISIHSMRKLQDYSEAKRYFDSIAPWRSEHTAPYGSKPIDDRCRRHKNIRIGREGEVRCRLYQTDVVIYWPDGSIELDYYPSVSTNAFVNALLPDGLTADYLKADPVVWARTWDERHSCVDRAGFHITSDNLRFKRVYQPNVGMYWILHEESGTPDVFTKYKLNRKVAKAVLAETKYADFSTWIAAIDAFERASGRKKRSQRWSIDLDREGVLALLNGGFKSWKKLYALCAEADVEPLKFVRDTLYRGVPGITTSEEVNVLWGGSYESEMSSSRRYEKF